MRSARSRVLPPLRRRFVPWQGMQILGLLVAVMILWPGVMAWLLNATSLLSWVYGPGFNEALERREELAVARLNVWAAVLSCPLSLATILAMVKASGGHPYQVGLTGSRIGSDVIVGFVMFLAVTPFIQVANGIITLLWRDWVGVPPPHALERIGEAQPPLFDWVLIGVSAMVAAPTVEELLYRGVLQPWFTSRREGGDIAVVGALVITVLAIWGHLFAAADYPEALIALAPLFFALAMVPVYLILRQTFRSTAVNGLFGTALLFGMAYSTVWPTPISLFLLGLALGLLYHRTQRVVPAMVAHGLFNAVSFGMLLSSALRPDKGQ